MKKLKLKFALLAKTRSCQNKKRKNKLCNKNSQKTESIKNNKKSKVMFYYFYM